MTTISTDIDHVRSAGNRSPRLSSGCRWDPDPGRTLGVLGPGIAGTHQRAREKLLTALGLASSDAWGLEDRVVLHTEVDHVTAAVVGTEVELPVTLLSRSPLLASGQLLATARAALAAFIDLKVERVRVYGEPAAQHRDAVRALLREVAPTVRRVEASDPGSPLRVTVGHESIADVEAAFCPGLVEL